MLKTHRVNVNLYLIQISNRLKSKSFTAVIDMAWGGWIKGRKSRLEMGIPYVRVEAANHPFVKGE